MSRVSFKFIISLVIASIIYFEVKPYYGILDQALLCLRQLNSGLSNPLSLETRGLIQNKNKKYHIMAANSKRGFRVDCADKVMVNNIRCKQN
jgi:hypothetical protein